MIRSGSPQVDSTAMAEAEKVRLPAHSPCLAEGCSSLNYSNGLCRSHYYKKRRAEAAALKPARVYPTCSRDGCEDRATGLGLCMRHYYQHYRHPERRISAEELPERYPSLRWGVKEWEAVLTVRGDVMDHLLDDMHRLAFP